MKKISLSNIKDSLTKNELSKIMAGSDVINQNAIYGCTCTYNNNPVITNDNTGKACRCTCL